MERKMYIGISKIYFVLVNQIGNRSDKIHIFRIRIGIENNMRNIGHKFSESL